ncbi:kinetochore-associated Ndc80 complex subunit spc25 [Maudiozyma exigua]|uniref:Kinetochore protein SPC25 n=1 Tax=Maudiozyma exigua TaxID=34358 RepID=A0A9P6W5I3_MAUEX|nr:kinetochore-associated Ndc80 complex subunit spc25 [Kazachstania exigua]
MGDQSKEYADLKQAMDQFSADVQDALKAKRANVADITNIFKSTALGLTNQINLLNESYETTSKELASLKQEYIEAEAVEEYTKKTHEEYLVRRKRLMQVKEKLDRESQEMEELDKKRHQMLRDFTEKLGQQVNKDDSEVKMYEHLLGINIDSSGAGVISFTFSNYDEMNPQAKCTITLAVDGPSFEIYKPTPRLPSEVRQELLDTLNKENDLSAFIIKARETLIAYSK